MSVVGSAIGQEKTCDFTGGLWELFFPPPVKSIGAGDAGKKKRRAPRKVITSDGEEVCE